VQDFSTHVTYGYTPPIIDTELIDSSCCPFMGPEYLKLRANTIVDSASGKAYYVLVTLSEDKLDFETSSLELRVTDGRYCWSKGGMLSSRVFFFRAKACSLIYTVPPVAV